MVGNSTQDQPWLDESLVQYITCQYFIDKYGEQAEQSCFNSMKARWDTINDEKIPLGEPVSYYSSAEYSAIVYGRGPFFFQALQQQIGTDAFNSMMQDYTSSYIWDIGTTEGFKQIAEQHCGCDLTPLFREWITP